MESKYTKRKWVKILPGCLIAFFLLGINPSVQAGEMRGTAGIALTTQVIPLYGLGFMGTYQTDLPFELLPDYRQEVSLAIYSLSGSGAISKGDFSDTVNVTWKSLEVDWFLLRPDTLGLDYFGPGIGYGIGEMTESDSTEVDLSPFYTAKDVHFGVLMVKGVKTFDKIVCEGLVSSFGGLIGGGVLCGVKF